jgi:hypothetical protein
MSRASTQPNSSSTSMQPLSSQPVVAWSTPEKPRREGKSILELNRSVCSIAFLVACYGCNLITIRALFQRSFLSLFSKNKIIFVSSKPIDYTLTEVILGFGVS